jgi:hypothetical protein
VFKLIEECETEFGVELGVQEVLPVLTPRELAALIARRTTEGGDAA